MLWKSFVMKLEFHAGDLYGGGCLHWVMGHREAAVSQFDGVEMLCLFLRETQEQSISLASPEIQALGVPSD